MCWVPREAREARSAPGGRNRELNLAELKSVIDDLGKWRPRITITGGEPFLHPDLIPFAAYIKQKGLRLNLNTNGLLLAKNADWLVALGIDDISVSIDGTPAVHDKIRGTEGAFKLAYEGLKAVRRARGESFKPIIRVNTTITPQNTAHLIELCQIARELQVDCLSYQHLWFLEPEKRHWHDRLFVKAFGQASPNLKHLDLLCEPIDIDLLYSQLEAIKEKRRHLPFRVYMYPEMGLDDLARYYSTNPRYLKSSCWSRWSRVDILPDGTVTPCLSYKAGNVREESFRQIWNNTRYRDFRRQLHKQGVWPACVRCCGLFSDQPAQR